MCDDVFIQSSVKVILRIDFFKLDFNKGRKKKEKDVSVASATTTTQQLLYF